MKLLLVSFSHIIKHLCGMGHGLLQQNQCDGPTNDVDINGLHYYYYQYYYEMTLLGQTRDDLLSNLFAGNARNKGKERQKQIPTAHVMYQTMFNLSWPVQGPNHFLYISFFHTPSSLPQTQHAYAFFWHTSQNLPQPFLISSV